MPIKRSVEEKQREKNPFRRTPASFHSSPPCQSLFSPPLNFSSIQATRYRDAIISPLFLSFHRSFSAFYYSPQSSFCLCLTKTQRGVWSSCPICHSDTVATIQGQKNKTKQKNIPHPSRLHLHQSQHTSVHTHTHFRNKREEMWQVLGNV